MNDVLNALKKAENIVIAGHVNPDGDSIGSCFALGLLLKAEGKKPAVVMEQYGGQFDCIPGRELLFDGSLKTLAPDTFVMLDLNTPDRLGPARAILKTENLTTVCIDHHISYGDFADVNFKDTQVSSTCELVYRLAKENFNISADIASALYAGIVYDTGGFRHPSTSAETMRVAAELMEIGIPHSDIYNSMMFSRELPEALVMSQAIGRLQILDGGIAVTYVTDEDLQNTGAVPSQLGGICEYSANIAGVEVSAFIYPKAAGLQKISLRSKSIPVNKIMEAMGGGGHQLACGCDFRGSLDEARDEVVGRLNEIIWN